MKITDYVKGTVSLIGDVFRLGMIFIKRPHYLLVLIGIILGIFYLCGVPPQKVPEWWKKTFVPAVSTRFDEFAMRTKKATSPLTDAVSDFVAPPVQKSPEKKEPEPLFVAPEKAPVKWGRHPSDNKGEAKPQTAESAVPSVSGAETSYKFKQKEHTLPVQPQTQPKRRVPAPEWRKIDENVDAAPVVMVPTHAANRGEVLDRMLDNVVRETAAEQQKTERARPSRPQPKGTLVEGTASVVGGDSLKIGGRVIRLKGLRIRSGRNAEAYRTLARRVNNMHVRCYFAEGEDKAVCYEGEENLAQYLIDMRLAD